MENKIKRGDIYYASLGDNNAVGSEQTGNRPVVIVQNNIGNQTSPTVIIAPITSKVNEKPKMTTHVVLEPLRNRLPKKSIILLEQLRTIDKLRLSSFVGSLNIEELEAVDRAIMNALGIN